ncbi:diaminopimelate epimerase [candidate division KSB1 bacterium]
MQFHKMHGLGNDFILINGTGSAVEKPAELARRLCNRRTGIGSDGLIVFSASPSTDFRMDFYNPDGSEAICGNGLRCLGRIVHDLGLTHRERITVDTIAGVRRLELKVTEGVVESVTVDMERPSFHRRDIPMEGPDDEVVDNTLTVDKDSFQVTCLSLGNPHCVIFSHDLDSVPLERLGPAIENHPLFPERTNVEFVEVIDSHNLRLRIWERGAGETLASGTGSTAAATAAIKCGLAESPVRVNLKLGAINIDWKPGEKAFMTGPASYVFRGETTDEQIVPNKDSTHGRTR